MAFNNCFYIKNVSGFPVTLGHSSVIYEDIGMQWSTDGVNWNAYTPGITTDLVLEDGVKYYFKGIATWGKGNEGVSLFKDPFLCLTENAKFEVGGSVMSLLHDGDGDNENFVRDEDGNFCTFGALFRGLSGTVDVSKLKLPSKVAPFYFAQMFTEVKVASVPDNFLPATQLASSCYRDMFSHSTISNTSKICIRAEKEAFRGCYNMFSNCTGLTEIELFLESLEVGECCVTMLNFCPDLTSITVHFKDWGSDATLNWVNGVASTGTFYCPEELPEERGISRIPNGWTIVRFAPRTDYYHGAMKVHGKQAPIYAIKNK